MRENILLIFLIIFSYAQEEQLKESTSLQVEIHIFGNSEQQKDKEAIIFQFDDHQKRGRQQNKFLIQELQESITVSIERIADDPNDAIFLSEVQKLSSLKNEQEIIQNENPNFGFLNQYISRLQPSVIQETEQIESALIDGQKETKLTNIKTRSTKIEIKRQNRQNDNSLQLQEEFLLYENPVVEDGEKFFGSEEEFFEEQQDHQNENYNIFKNGLYVKYENVLRNEEVNNVKEESRLNLFLELEILGGIVIALFIGYWIKLLMQNKNNKGMFKKN
ncbi:unnamed protein product [Paramecium sonneborni]|uniref:Transmembrane protein n=1 Tax=Paramecium sonneborni TaxID=65129 RepID=A0A8S1KWR0_9CILI|nr:unnamed protein product [Paramecium sonneborni]